MYPQYISKYIIKYPRTYPNPEIIYSYLVRICSSIFLLIQQAYWINPSEIFSFFSLAIAPLRINRRGPVFRERCSKRGVLFSLAARATCGFPSPPLQARGFRYLEEPVSATGGGRGEKDRFVSKGIDGHGARKAVSIPSRVAREETGLVDVLMSRLSRWATSFR